MSFMENMMRLGMIVGMWLAIGMVATSSIAATCAVTGVLTVVLLAFIAKDVRKAWDEHNAKLR